MSGRTYWAEVVGEGPVNGRLVAVRLGSYPAPSRRLALRWLRERAMWIANRLDPDPTNTPWLPSHALRPVSHQQADVPTRLRRWCTDPVAQEAANDQLAHGAPFYFSAADHHGRYVLEAWSVNVPTLPAPYAPHRRRLWSVA